MRTRGSVFKRQIPSARILVAALATGTLVACAALGPAARAATLPVGFTETTIATGLPNGAVSIAWAPDGRMFIADATGGGNIHIFNPGSTTIAKTLKLTNNVYGIALDRDFASNGYLYAVRSHGGNTSQRLVRVRVLPDNTLENPTNPQTVLLGSMTSTCPPPSNTADCITAASPHDMGTVASDPRDGTLWVGNGDGGNLGGQTSFQALDERSLHGKILHVDRNGRGLPGHPFCPTDGDLTHNCTKVAAMGFRNPFRFTLRPGGDPVVADVGWAAREEVSLLVRGKSFGWPCYEGTVRTPSYRDDPKCAAEYSKEGTTGASVLPVYDYAQTPPGTSITGGPTYRAAGYPADFNGNVFFGDYVQGYIKRLQLDSAGKFVAVKDFATGVPGLVDLQLAPNGDLVYVLLNGTVKRVSFAGSANRAPTAQASSDKSSGPTPLTVAFKSTGSSDPDGDPLTYEWDFGDGTAHSTAANPSHTYSANGNYTARLTVRDGKGGSDTASIPISAGNSAPNITINAPATYRAGQAFTVTGSANDPESGALPASALKWETKLVHVEHVHDPQAPTGVAQISLTAPTDHDADTYFEVKLSATDSSGATGTKTITVNPETRRLTIASSPTGAPISYGGRDFTAPLSKQSTIGYRVPISAAASFSSGGQTQEFDSWSDGGARLHEITVPATDSTFTARYKQGTGTGGGSGTAFEAESMQGVLSTGRAKSVANASASGGREVFMTSNVSISKTLLLPGSSRLTVRARGDQCQGAPIMSVRLDGAQVMSVPVAQTTFGDYSADIDIPAGQHTIAVAFVNDFRSGCDRNLRVDKVTVGPDGTPPPPPPPSGDTIEAESMSGVTSSGAARSVANTAASGGREVFFVQNAVISKTVSLSASTKLTVRARGDQCQGAPIMVVKIDGAQVMSVPVSQTTFGDLSASIGVSAGAHAVDVAFVNDFRSGCDRNLRVDKLTFSP